MQFLKKNRTGIAVGTPARLADLMDNGKFLGIQPAPHWHTASLSLSNENN